MSSPAPTQSHNRWSYTSSGLWFTCATYALADLFFGYDSGMFSTLQSLPSFLKVFGENIGGKQKLPTKRSSLMNSTVWIGKLAGTLSFEPICERIGFRWTMFLTCIIQIVAAIIEITSTNWVTFTVGRCFSYTAQGLVENCVPTFASEVAPAPVRSVFTGSVTFVLVIGQLWSNLMGRAYRNVVTERGWKIPVAMQLIPPVIIVCFLPFTPESPRWLLLHGKKDQAQKALNRVRNKREVESGVTVMEIEAIDEAIAESRLREHGSWLDIFRGTYLRRTCIAAWMFIFQQINGTQFIQTFGATFYLQMGLGDKSFDYTCITSACLIVALGTGIYLYDKLGRRPVMIAAVLFQTPLMAIVAGVGGKAHPTREDVNAVVACNILFTCSARMATDSAAYVVCSEIGGVKLRRKIMSFATSWQVLAAFVVTYSSPYLLASPGLDLGAKVGWIFFVISCFCVIFIVFFVPELRGRSLEEVDELFERRLWAWQFSKAETSGVGARIAELEGAHESHADSKSTPAEAGNVEDVDQKRVDYEHLELA